ncbi:SRPBCC family protein [Myceligenerans cantabricum]
MTDSSRHTTKIATAVATVGMTAALTACGAGDAAGGAGATASATGSAEQVQEDTQGQENQCGGMGIDDSAVVTSSTEIVIDAPLDEVWDVHTDVEGWARWQDAVLTVERLDSGDLAPGSRFRWTTPVPESDFAPADTLTITSTVLRVEPGECVLWEGPAIGEAITIEEGTHLWTFTETDEGTLVHTEESWDAELLDSLPEADVDPVATMLGGGLEIWLQALKAEAGSRVSR